MSHSVERGQRGSAHSAWLVKIFVATVLGLLVHSSARATVIVPAGVNPGETYHLVFVTSTTRDATGLLMQDYNDFVQDAADTAGIGISEGLEWSAIASVYPDFANSNTLVSGSVYLLDGTTKVADDYADMWNASINAPINLDETLSIVSAGTRVWTGSYADGEGRPLLEMGNPTSSASYGFAHSSDYHWIEGDSTSKTDLYPFYALSEPLIAPPVPEPSAFILSAIALGGLLVLRRYRRWKSAVASK